MRHDKLEKQLDLLLLLVENKNYTVLDLCQRLGITRRNLYYYLDFFRLAGFRLIKTGYFYRLDRQSPFFKRLHESIDFTEQEAIFLRKMLSGADRNNPMVTQIQHKLDSFYDLRILTDVKLQAQMAKNVSIIYEAIKMKQLVRLKNYSSPHSHTTSDRIIEPFLFLNDNTDIRGFELASGKNKTYKLSRMESVEIIDLLWSNEDKHRQLKTDIFLFSGEETMPVHLILGQLAYNIIKEEYPQSVDYIHYAGEQQWELHLDVCDYRGIGRFVMGLWNDVQVLGDEQFKDYLRQNISQMKI